MDLPLFARPSQHSDMICACFAQLDMPHFIVDSGGDMSGYFSGTLPLPLPTIIVAIVRHHQGIQ